MKTITVFKYLEIRGKEAKEKYSLYSMSMGEIILNKIFSRETSLMKWIIEKQSTWKGCSVSMPGNFSEQVEDMDWVSS